MSTSKIKLIFIRLYEHSSFSSLDFLMCAGGCYNYLYDMLLSVSRRTLFASFAYIMLSLLLVNFFNEGGENTPMENLKFRGRWVSFAYYVSQVILMLGYLRFQRFGWATMLLIVALVATLRSLSSGVAILTIAMVMGREMVMRPGSRP